jgi:hypothetical protein
MKGKDDAEGKKVRCPACTLSFSIPHAALPADWQPIVEPPHTSLPPEANEEAPRPIHTNSIASKSGPQRWRHYAVVGFMLFLVLWALASASNIAPPHQLVYPVVLLLMFGAVWVVQRLNDIARASRLYERKNR